MFLFKRYKKKEIALQVKQSYILFKQWEKMKQKLACYLHHRSELLSLKSKKLILLFFFIVCSTGSIFIIINASVKGNNITVKQISKPASTKDSTHLETKSDSAITEKDYKRIERFKSYLLQLRDDSTTGKKFDSIMRQRLYLLDSITLFEKMYLSQ